MIGSEEKIIEGQGQELSPYAMSSFLNTFFHILYNL